MESVAFIRFSPMEVKKCVNLFPSEALGLVDASALAECVAKLELRQNVQEWFEQCLDKANQVASLSRSGSRSHELIDLVSKWRIKDYDFKTSTDPANGDLEWASVLILLPDGRIDTARVAKETAVSSCRLEVRSILGDLIVGMDLSSREEMNFINADPNALMSRYGLPSQYEVLVMFRALFAMIDCELNVD